MLTDTREGLNFSYNLLNLLREVKVGATVKATYTWLADGSKLRVRDASSNGFDYLGSLTYTGSSSGLQLESASFPGGVIRSTGSGAPASQEINYFLTDHLGSVRVIVDATGNVKERNDFYAFGVKHIRSDYPQSDNRYDYNGKEEQTTGNLRFLDYGARMYDNRIGRWFNVDPLAEDTPFISPYTYCYNNPVGFIDLFGLAGFQTTDPEQIRAFLDHLKGGGDIDDYDVTEWDDYIDVHVTLPPVVVTGKKQGYWAEWGLPIFGVTLRVSGVLLADDFSGIGVADDVLIVPVWATGVAVAAVGWGIYEFAQHGWNNGRLESGELETLRQRQEAGTATKKEKQKLKKDEKNREQRHSRQGKDKKKK